jgi:hypothetical protein
MKTINTEEDLLRYAMHQMSFIDRELRVVRFCLILKVYAFLKHDIDETEIDPYFVNVDLLPFCVKKFAQYNTGKTLATFITVTYTHEYFEEDTVLYRKVIIDDLLNDLA